MVKKKKRVKRARIKKKVKTKRKSEKKFAIAGWILFSVGLAFALINKVITGAAIGFSVGDVLGAAGVVAFILGLVFLFLHERGKEGRLEKNLAKQLLSKGGKLPSSAEAIAEIAEDMDAHVKRGKDSIGIAYKGRKFNIQKGRHLSDGESRRYLRQLAYS